MSSLYFADNTVLVNFCLIGEIPLLETLLNGRGAWTASVEIECAESSGYPGLSDLSQVPAFMGTAYAPDGRREIEAVTMIWDWLRSPGDGPEKHLGEAETLAIIHQRPLDAVIVTDDTGALRAAGRIQVPVVTTVSLLTLAARVNLITTQRAWDLMTTLQTRHDRFLPGAAPSFADHMMRCTP